MSIFQVRNIFAVLRGITPNEILAVAKCLSSLGISLIEVTLNSPDAFKSIELLIQAKEDGRLNNDNDTHGKNNAHNNNTEIYIGAGTVSKLSEVKDLHKLGISFVISPHFDSKLVELTKTLGMTSIPGVFSVSECYAALHSGADILKLFPASLLGVQGIQAMKATLPSTAKLFAVGGIGAEDFEAFAEVGVLGFGIGNSLYKPGKDLQAIASSAESIVKSYDKVFSQKES